MPEVGVGGGPSFRTYKDIKPVDRTSGFQDLYQAGVNFGTGVIDENILTLGALHAVKAINSETNVYKYDPDYNIFADPQLDNLKDYIGNFMHSNNADHTKELIKKFYDKQSKVGGSPAYIIGRIIGGLLDPSSIFAFTKAGSFLMTGSRLKRAAGFGGIVSAEEASKRLFTDERPMNETLIISAGGFIIPAMFPSLPRSVGKNFDETADALDAADDVIFNSKYSVGAASPKSSTLLREEELQKLNKIKKTGLGLLAEDSGINPVFRVLQKGISNAQIMIENILESKLYQVKNTKDGITVTQTIERSIAARYTELVLKNTTIIEAAYTDYLKRLGIKPQGFFERTLDTKFGTNKGNVKVMSPKQFREQVTSYRMGNKNVEPEVIQASKGSDDFFNIIGKEYETLEIVPQWANAQIQYLSLLEATVTKADVKANIAARIRKLEKDRDALIKKGILRKGMYVPILYKKDEIVRRFADFELLMRRAIARSGTKLSDDEINKIIESFVEYQPYIAYENIARQFKRLSRYSTMNASEKELLETELLTKMDRISSRFKARNLDIDYEELAAAGFIEKDINIINRMYYNQTIPDIEITKRFGDPMGYGSNYQAGKNIVGMRQIAEEYDDMIEDSLKVVNGKKVMTAKTKKLIKEKDQILEDLDASIGLARGTYGLAEDPNRAVSRGIRISKLYNATTMLTGISQVVDTARLVAINGVGKTFKLSWEMYSSGMGKEIFKMSRRSANLGGEALDMATSQRAMSMYGMDDVHGVFNKFERGVSSVGNLYFTFLNLSNPWNTGVKTMAVFFNGSRMLESIEKLVLTGKLDKVNKMRLRNLGITDDLAKKIYTQYTKHGYGKNAKSWKSVGDNYKYMRVGNTEAWDQTDEAIEATKAFHAALGKQARIDIVTPSKGDVPLWSNTELGGIILQFKKFGIASTQSMLFRGMQERDALFLQSVLMLMAAGAMVDAFRQKAFDRDYSKKPTGQKLVDAFDRSGLGGYFSDINNAIERLSNNQIGARPLLGSKKPYGTYNQKKNLGPYGMPIADVLGPTASQLENIADIAFSWGTGKYNHHTAKNVRRLLPFQNVWFLDSLFDEVEKEGLR